MVQWLDLRGRGQHPLGRLYGDRGRVALAVRFLFFDFSKCDHEGVSMTRFGTKTAQVLLVTASAGALASFALTAGAFAQDDAPVESDDRLVVRGVNIPDEKRETSEISAVLDAEDFSLTGDADAAAALQRVTGLSLSRGRFVIVRGLNERYTSATINGSPLPSPEPLRRVAPLDLFPTNVLDSVLVQKTYSPEYTLEFGGGLVDLRTRRLPNERFLELNASANYNTEISGDDDVLIYDGGDADVLGYDDDTRDLPAALDATFYAGQLNGLSGDEQRQAAFDLADPSLWVLQRGPVAPGFGFELNAGDRFDVSDSLSIGVTTALSYDNDWSARDGFRSDVTDNGSVVSEFDRERASNEIKSSAFGSVGFDVLDSHEVGIVGLLTRSTDRSVERRSNFSDASIDEAQEDITQYFERQAWITQISGESNFYFDLPVIKGLDVNWRASYGEATRDAPYDTSVVYEPTSGGLGVVDAGNINVGFGVLDDTTTDSGVDLVVPVELGPIFGDLKGGYAYRKSTRSSIDRLYTMEGTPSAFPDRRIDVLIPEASLSLREVESDLFVEAFEGLLELDAFYASADLQLNDFIRAQFGVRYEDSIQLGDTFSRSQYGQAAFENTNFGPSSAETGSTLPGVTEQGISSEYLLPAATVTWNFAADQQVRLAYSQTVTRPQFRESSPQVFLNNLTLFDSRGNPFLTNAELTNYDIRYEWYFAREQFLTFGLFYKEVDNAIVEYDATVGDDIFIGFVNAPTAVLRGVEVEFEKEITDWLAIGPAKDWFSDSEFTITSNYTFTSSDVSNAGDVVVPGRLDTSTGIVARDVFAASVFIADDAELQGQSEHIFNLQLGYENFATRSTARLLLNYNSDRVFAYQASSGNRPVTYEDPPLLLDLRFKQGFDVVDREFELAFTLRNLLGEEFRLYRDVAFGGVASEATFDQYDLGQSVSVSLSAKF